MSSTSPDEPIGPGGIPLRCYLPRTESLRAARRFFSHATSSFISNSNSNNEDNSASANTRYYFSDRDANDFNNNCTAVAKVAQTKTSVTSATKSTTSNITKTKCRSLAQPSQANSDGQMPSRWYTVLALPFPDQTVGRRDILGTVAYGRRQRHHLVDSKHRTLSRIQQQQHHHRSGCKKSKLRKQQSQNAPSTLTANSTIRNLQLFAPSLRGGDSDLSSMATSSLFRRPPTTTIAAAAAPADCSYSTDPQASL